MEAPASRETHQPEAVVKPARVVSKPTSPEQMHHETAAKITANLEAAGHPATLENVKSNQPFQSPPDLKKLGVEPSDTDLSPENMIRLVTEEFESADSGSHRVVVGKGEFGVGMNKGRQNKMRSLLSRLRLNKAA